MRAWLPSALLAACLAGVTACGADDSPTSRPSPTRSTVVTGANAAPENPQRRREEEGGPIAPAAPREGGPDRVNRAPGEQPPVARRPHEAPDDLRDFRRRCARLNDAGAQARVLYEARREMTRGDAETVSAVVTLDRSAPADQILRRGEAADEPGVLVSCRVEAQLTASPYEFELNERRWVERSLLTGDTARWSWYVTPKVGGRHTLLLKVRPILRTFPTDGVPASVILAESSNVQEYETVVHVDVPWTERPQETMSRIAATLKVAEGLVRAATALLAAMLALLAVLGLRHRRKGRDTAAARPGQPVEPSDDSARDRR